MQNLDSGLWTGIWTQILDCSLLKNSWNETPESSKPIEFLGTVGTMVEIWEARETVRIMHFFFFLVCAYFPYCVYSAFLCLTVCCAEVAMHCHGLDDRVL